MRLPKAVRSLKNRKLYNLKYFYCTDYWVEQWWEMPKLQRFKCVFAVGVTVTARWSKIPFDKNSSGDEFFHNVNKIFGKIENTFLISSKNIWRL